MKITFYIVCLACITTAGFPSDLLRKLETDLQVDLYPTSNLVESVHLGAQSSLMTRILELEYECERIGEGEYLRGRKILEKLDDLAARFVKTIEKFEKDGARIYLLAARGESPLSGHEAVYVAVTEGHLVFITNDGETIDETGLESGDETWLPGRLLRDWIRENRLPEDDAVPSHEKNEAMIEGESTDSTPNEPVP